MYRLEERIQANTSNFSAREIEAQSSHMGTQTLRVKLAKELGFQIGFWSHLVMYLSLYQWNGPTSYCSYYPGKREAKTSRDHRKGRGGEELLPSMSCPCSFHPCTQLCGWCVEASFLMHKPLGHLRVMVCYCCLVAKSTLCDPTDCSSSDSSVHGILQVRKLEWIAISFFRGFSQPRYRTRVSWTAVGFFTTELSGKPDDLLACRN